MKYGIKVRMPGDFLAVFITQTQGGEIMEFETEDLARSFASKHVDKSIFIISWEVAIIKPKQ